MRKFESTKGDIYTGNVVFQFGLEVLMDNYSVWYYGESLPYSTEHADDSVLFMANCELSL